MSYQTFKVEFFKEGTIAKVTICRPKALNAMNPKFFQEIGTIFNSLNSKDNLRVVVLVAEGKVFTAGLDLKQYGSLFSADLQEQDVARFSKNLYEKIIQMQKPFLSIYDCKVPVLVGVHGKCIGGGVDLISMCDIRYCSADAEFTIKQIDIGMAADLGTLQFMSNISGSQSTFRQLAYTGRFLKAEEAKQIGFVTRVLANKEQLEKQLMKNAEIIASKSPIGIYTLKQVIKRQFRKKIEDSLQYIARVNSSMLITKDTSQAISAFLQKRQPIFSKL